MNEIYFESMSPAMFLLLILVIGMIVFIVLIEPRIFRRKLLNKNEHGSSKFADIKEIKENFDIEKIDNIEKAGVPVFYEKCNGSFKNIYFDNKSPHYVLIGSTGAGKSVTVNIPMSIHFATAKEKHSVVITDPKGELFRKTGKVFKDNDYNVVTIDFRNPTKSNKINIMQPIIDEWKEHCCYSKYAIFLISHFLKFNEISLEKFWEDEKYRDKIKKDFSLEENIINFIKDNNIEIISNIENPKFYEYIKFSNYNEKNIKETLEHKSNKELLNQIKENQNKSIKHQAETNRLVISLANLIFVEKETKDPFWINAAKQLFIGIVGIFLEDFRDGLIDEKKINISSIKKFQNSSLIKENQIYLQGNLNNRKYGNLSKDYLTSIIFSAENTYKSITAIFGEKMAIFDDLNVENITSVSEFSFTSIGKEPTALFIIVPDEDKSYFQLVTIILGMLIKDLTKFANLPENNGTLPIKVEWLLEEFANCPPLDAIETTISMARSRGMRFFFSIQSFSQLNQIYGKETANIILDNSALQFLKTNSVECAEIIAKKLGSTTLETNSMSMSTDPFKIGANKTLSLMGRELLTANEIISLNHKTIIFPVFGNPIFRDTYMYNELYPQYADISIVERKERTLKRLNNNYYTVEQMKEKQLQLANKEITSQIKEMKKNFSQTNKWVHKQLNNEIDETASDLKALNMFASDLKQILKEKISSQKLLNDIYVFKIDSLLNKFELTKIETIKNDEVAIEIASNTRIKKTTIIVWNV